MVSTEFLIRERAVPAGEWESIFFANRLFRNRFFV